MTYEEAIEIIKNNYPKTAKMVNGRYKGGFDDTESKLGQALNMAIEALEKQIPKKPKGKDDNFGISYGICPNCDNIVDDWNDNCFCNECGQAIDWEGTE